MLTKIGGLGMLNSELTRFFSQFVIHSHQRVLLVDQGKSPVREEWIYVPLQQSGLGCGIG